MENVKSFFNLPTIKPRNIKLFYGTNKMPLGKILYIFSKYSNFIIVLEKYKTTKQGTAQNEPKGK